MKKTLLMSLALVSTVSLATAQQRYPGSVDRADYKVLNEQASSIFKQANPLVKSVSKSVVSIQIKGKQIAYGTVTEHGIITKWSEIQHKLANLRVVSSDGKSQRVKLLGVYPNYDLAIIKNSAKLPAISLKQAQPAQPGDFLVMSGADKQAAGFGVVSVKKRSLRETDKAFMGIQMNFQDTSIGVRIDRVVEGSGAIKAGLVAGDYLKSIDGVNLLSPLQTRAIIQKLKPGQQIKLGIQRAGKPKILDVLLGARPKQNAFPQGRLNRMERMGGAISKVRGGFPSTVQSDMQISASQMAAPVINLNGNFVGLTLSRSRIKTHIVPAAELEKLLQTKPTSAKDALAALKQTPKRPFTRPGKQPKQGSPAKTREQKLKELEEKMFKMREEMLRLERELRKMRR